MGRWFPKPKGKAGASVGETRKVSYRFGKDNDPDTLALNNGKEKYIVGRTAGRDPEEKERNLFLATTGGKYGLLYDKGAERTPGGRSRDFPNRHEFNESDAESEDIKRDVRKHVGPIRNPKHGSGKFGGSGSSGRW